MSTIIHVHNIVRIERQDKQFGRFATSDFVFTDSQGHEVTITAFCEGKPLPVEHQPMRVIPPVEAGLEAA